MKRYITANSKTSEFNQYLIEKYNGNSYAVHYRYVEYAEYDDGSDFINQFKAQVSEISPYDEAIYYWADIHNGQINYIYDNEVKDTDWYPSPADMDVEPYEWFDEVIQIAIRALDTLNSSISSRIIHD